MSGMQMKTFVLRHMVGSWGDVKQQQQQQQQQQ